MPGTPRIVRQARARTPESAPAPRETPLAPPRPDAESAIRDVGDLQERRHASRLRTPRARSERIAGSRIPLPRGPNEVGVYVRSFHHAESFGLGFDGDHRGFSTDPMDTARIRAGVVLRRSERGLRIVQSGARSDVSQHPLLGRGLAHPNATATTRDQGQGVTRLSLDYEGSVPLLPVAPDIDVNASIDLREREGRLEVVATLRGDEFPNVEAFLRDHEGNAVFVGVHVLRARQFAPLSLAGDGDDVMVDVALAIVRGPDGAFVGVEYDGASYTLAEWNALFEQAPPERGASLLDPAQDEPLPPPVNSPRED